MNTTLSDQRKYAWDYFALHADQRLKAFNFYLLLSALVITGILATFKKDEQNPLITIVLAIILAFLSFIFRGLDERNKELIGIAEQALKHLESDLGPSGTNGEPHVLQLFQREHFQTNNLKKERNCLCKGFHVAYSNCFRLVFRTFGYGSVGFVIIHLWLLFTR